MTTSSPTRPRSSTGPVVVRDLAPDDLSSTAALQACARATGALDAPAALGAGFLRRWQRAHLGTPCATALVAEQVDDVTGLLLAVGDRGARRDHLLRHHGPGLLAAAAATSLRDPRAAGRWARLRTGPLVRAVTLLPTRGASAADARRAERSSQQPVAPPAGVVVVEAVVVDGGRRRAGIGRELLSALAARSAGAGVDRLEARVPWGSGAEGFFLACGWTPAPTRPSPRGGFETVFHLDL